VIQEASVVHSSVELETNSSREELEGVSVLFRIEDIRSDEI
jgi:hypothetical protein